MDIKEAFKELKAMAPKDEYISLDYTMNRYADGCEDVECSVYIASAERFVAPTFRMALDQAKAALGLIISDKLNIEG